MYPQLSTLMFVCLMGASLLILTDSMSSQRFGVSEYRSQGGAPPTGDSIYSS